MITWTLSEIRSIWLGAIRKVLPMAETASGTAALQADDSGNLKITGSVTATTTALEALLAIPTKHTAITKSDSTDLTALANVGVLIGGAGDLAYRLTGAPTTTVTLAVVAGQFVPGQFTRVMAATTATGIVGVAR